MSKKSTLILLSILHICILGICVLTIYANRTSEVMIAHVSSETKSIDSQTASGAETESGTGTDPGTAQESVTEPPAETEPSTETEIEADPGTETISESETETPPDTESSPVYSFHYVGTRVNLNIRSAPSTNDTIIGKIPCGGNGSVLELTNDEWALIEYQGVIGYCSRRYLELQEIEN